jgi:hypothetical protein
MQVAAPDMMTSTHPDRADPNSHIHAANRVIGLPYGQATVSQSRRPNAPKNRGSSLFQMGDLARTSPAMR